MHNYDESDDSDDDFGPQPVQDTDANEGNNELIADSAHEGTLPPNKKMRRQLDNQMTYIENLPNAEYYEFSYMHRDVVTHVAVSKAAEFIITGSQDGHVKFWKKMHKNIEFVKHFQAHLTPLNCMNISNDQKMLVTTGNDKMVKFFDVIGFDMAKMMAVDYTPTIAVWLCGKTNLCDNVAVAESTSGLIRIYNANGLNFPLHELYLHQNPIKCMAFNPVQKIVISMDSKGIIEYWDTVNYSMPTYPKQISFSMKLETDLYDLMKSKSIPCALAIANDGDKFAVLSTDKQIRLYDFKKGKLLRRYDESSQAYQTKKMDGQESKESSNKMQGKVDLLEFGRRLALERELESNIDAISLSTITFDESGNFLIFGSLKGIKIVNLINNRVVTTVGSGETAGERFLAVALYQGVPKIDQQFLLSRAGNDATSVKTSDELQKESENDPTLYCTSFKKRRFFCFSRRLPAADDTGSISRDIFNELPTEEERTTDKQSVIKILPDSVILRTTLGDITLKLFATECPRTVENFITHVRNGYYNNLIFHRVIKGFMIQTGDPSGDGTGGESIWGKEFEDEFVKTLRHDRPFTVSMANAGPNTNGSQFFITTVPAAWLDNKHTVFGRVVKGYEVVSSIESVKVSKLDKPFDPIKILSAEILT